MKIGIVTSEFPPDIGGVETYSYEFAKNLASLGHEVTVFLHHNHKVDQEIAGIKLIPILRFCRRIDRIKLREYSMDVWHVMNAAHSWLTLDTDRPVIVSIHGNDFLRPYPLIGRLGINIKVLWRVSDLISHFDAWLGKYITSYYMKRALPKAKYILANSQYTKEIFLRSYPKCTQNTLVAQVGVSDIFLKSGPKIKSDTTPKLLTVSRLSEPRKNVDLVLYALAKIAGEFDFQYSIIGDGKDRKALEELTLQLGLENKVRFLGFQPNSLLIQAMQNADLFILTSSVLSDSHEGFGIVYLEAAASGTPSLASRLAGAVEAIDEGKSGYFVEQPTIENIALALKKFLAKEIVFSPENCHEFAKRFAWINICKKVPLYNQ